MNKYKRHVTDLEKRNTIKKSFAIAASSYINVLTADEKSEPHLYLVDKKDPAENGALLNSTIDKINKLDSSKKVLIRVVEDVLLNSNTTVNKTPYKRCGVKKVVGLNHIYKNNVTIESNHRTIKIDRGVNFNKKEKGLCGLTDEYASVFSVSGDEFALININIDGNCSERNIKRKPGRGYGGEEAGIVLLGRDSKIIGCQVENFSTDSIIVSNSSQISSCTVVGSYRNQISVVSYTKKKFVVVVDQTQIVGGEESYSIRPGSGIHVECNKGVATLKVRNTSIRKTFGSSIRISVGARNCEINNVTVDKSIDIVDRNECNYGGHKVVGGNAAAHLRERFRICER